MRSRSICRLDSASKCRFVAAERRCGCIADNAIFDGLVEHVPESFPIANHSSIDFARKTVAIIDFADIEYRCDAADATAATSHFAEEPLAIVDGQCDRHMQREQQEKTSVCLPRMRQSIQRSLQFDAPHARPYRCPTVRMQDLWQRFSPSEHAMSSQDHPHIGQAA